ERGGKRERESERERVSERVRELEGDGRKKKREKDRRVGWSGVVCISLALVGSRLSAAPVVWVAEIQSWLPEAMQHCVCVCVCVCECGRARVCGGVCVGVC